MPRGSQKYFTRDPITGEITFNFDGKILARGLDIIAGTGAAPPDDRRIRWITSILGAVVSEMYATYDAINGAEYVRRTAGTGTGAIDFVDVLDGTSYAELTVRAQDGDPDATRIVAEVSGHIARIMDGNGKSSFLQSVVNTDRKHNFGRHIPGIGFGGNNRLVSQNIAHGLGVVPSGYMATAGFLAGADTSTLADETVTCSQYTADATNIRFLYTISNGAIAAIGPPNVDWAAWT